MKLAKQKTSFTAFKTGLLLLLAVLTLYVGYLLYSSYKTSSQQTISTSVEDVQTAPAIKQSTDLEEAATTIDQAQLESSNIEDMNEIDKELSSF